MARARILLVDDDPDLRLALKVRLKAGGYDVVEAQDGLEALRAVRNETPDLILLDLMLPRLDGYHVCKLLKSDERYQSLPIIILSARGQEKDRALAIEVGASAFLTKPYDPAELTRHIEDSLRITERSGFTLPTED